MRTFALVQELKARLALADQPAQPSRADATAPARPGEGRSGFVPRLHPPAAPKDPALLEKLVRSTVARIGVGRAGTRLRTTTLLEFLAGRAVAVAAVQSQLPDGFDRTIGAKAYVKTRAKDLEELLFQPELGRNLDEAALATITGACKTGVDVQPIVGDGLSAKAVTENAPPFLAAFAAECQRLGLSLGDVVLAKHARVKLMDPIGAALAARTAVILVGERPALGTGDGMSAYLMFGPRDEAMDSDREVVSNINARSFKPEEAAKRVAAMLAEFIKVGGSGVKRLAGARPAAAQDRASALAAVAR